MREVAYGCSVLLAAVMVVLASTAALEAGPLDRLPVAVSYSGDLSATTTTDVVDPTASYLGSNTLAVVAEMDSATVAEALGVKPASLPDYLPMRTTVVAYNAPAVPGVLAAAPQPPAELASFQLPDVKGLADLGSGGRDVPLGDTTYFSMGPGGFGGMMSGRPVGSIENWSHVTRTAISYIRPSVNVQMMLAFEVPGAAPINDFEGPGADPRAYLAIDRQTKVDSANIGASTPRFGHRATPPPPDEPQTAVAAGLDLGLLPTFLSQMGVGISVVASRGSETGNLRVALVGTAELPVDWAPRERPYQHPVGLAEQPILAASAVWDYPSGSIGSSRPPGGGGGGGGTTPTPITPTPVPEPTMLAGLAASAIVLLLRRRRG
ncbi:MAG TPA: PEP-CTERM sorting domain-containing protein [Phycisphaerae bacterium]|nr:PEP-CTERM sorting domain-containing protein [Phycisphaerae bacterium]